MAFSMTLTDVEHGASDGSDPLYVFLVSIPTRRDPHVGESHLVRLTRTELDDLITGLQQS